MPLFYYSGIGQDHGEDGLVLAWVRHSPKCPPCPLQVAIGAALDQAPQQLHVPPQSLILTNLAVGRAALEFEVEENEEHAAARPLDAKYQNAAPLLQLAIHSAHRGDHIGKRRLPIQDPLRVEDMMISEPSMCGDPPTRLGPPVVVT